jgi:hypothetical protein
MIRHHLRNLQNQLSMSFLMTLCTADANQPGTATAKRVWPSKSCWLLWAAWKHAGTEETATHCRSKAIVHKKEREAGACQGEIVQICDVHVKYEHTKHVDHSDKPR